MRLLALACFTSLIHIFWGMLKFFNVITFHFISTWHTCIISIVSLDLEMLSRRAEISGYLYNPSFSQKLDWYITPSHGQFLQYQSKKYVCIFITNIWSIIQMWWEVDFILLVWNIQLIFKNQVLILADRKQWPSVSCCHLPKLVKRHQTYN